MVLQDPQVEGSKRTVVNPGTNSPAVFAGLNLLQGGFFALYVFDLCMLAVDSVEPLSCEAVRRGTFPYLLYVFTRVSGQEWTLAKANRWSIT